MVCKYLPYDDDPSNQQGDKINDFPRRQLYRNYIMETKLQVSAHVSIQAQHLVLRILVKDPVKRANISEIQSDG